MKLFIIIRSYAMKSSFLIQFFFSLHRRKRKQPLADLEPAILEITEESYVLPSAEFDLDFI